MFKNNSIIDPLGCLGAVDPMSFPPVSAVVLHWKRTENVVRIVKYLIKKSYIDEIIIWNNNPIKLNLGFGHPKLKIINSPENLKDQAKYMACAEARNDICFYQDDDHITKFFMDATYFAYCMHPGRLHTLVPALGWLANWYRTYFNPDKNIHAAFSWIGAGAFFPKSFAIRYLSILDTHFSKEECEIADYGFSVLLNQQIVQLQMGPLKLDQIDALSLTPGFDERLRAMQIKVARLLSNYGSEEITMPSCVPRSISMEAILFTSFLPIDLDIKSRIFDPENEQHVLERTNKHIPIASLRFFKNQSYSFGLSNVEGRYWSSKFSKGNIWGIVVWDPYTVKLQTLDNLSFSDEKVWQVYADTYYTECSTKELFSQRFPVCSTLCITYVGGSDMEITINIKLSKYES